MAWFISTLQEVKIQTFKLFKCVICSRLPKAWPGLLWVIGYYLTCFVGVSQCRQEKTITDVHSGKEKVKLTSFSVDRITYLENPREFSKVSSKYSLTRQKTMGLLYINSLLGDIMEETPHL